MQTHLCKYNMECPVYQGNAGINGNPLTIYKNVFCNRGSKGWDNCEQFMEYKKQELLKSKGVIKSKLI